jgi:hypothetical protein
MVAACILVGAFLTGIPALGTEEKSGAITPADRDSLKSLLRAAAAYDGAGRKEQELTRKQLAALAETVGDPKLRERTKQLLPDLEQAAVRHARVRRVVADVKAAKGTVKTEPAGPKWLREAVGDEPVEVFAGLVEIDLCDRSIPIKSGVKNERINDDWLERLSGLPDLRSLDISLTVVRGPGLRSVGTLKNLETLNLTLTLITDEHLHHLRGLTNLKKLLLASTQCNGAGLKGLDSLTRLENLNCHSAPVTDAGLEAIGRLSGLERLEIVHTRFTDTGAKHLAGLTNLRRLQLGSRGATGAGVAPLRALKNLRELDLHDGLVSAEGVKHAAEIPSLRVLRLYAGPVKDEGFAPVARLTDLEMLIAQHLQITDESLKVLKELKKLKRLDITGNKVSDSAVAELKKALPGLEVLR